MLRAGSLFYALATAVIIALLCSGIILAASFRDRLNIADRNKEKQIRNAASGIEWLLANGEAPPFEKEIDLYGTGGDSVRLEKKYWGAFDILLARAHHRSEGFEQIAVCGMQDTGSTTALVLADLDRPLSICGKTELNGDCYLPAAGIKRAYIEGQNFTGDKLVNGQSLKAERYLPPCDEKRLEEIRRLFAGTPGENDSLMAAEELKPGDSLFRSFSGTALWVYAKQKITIGSGYAGGQICFVSQTGIELGSDARLSHVLLAAPYIRIGKKTKGQFQAFARDSLIVEEECELAYPSIIALLADSRSPDKACIKIGRGVTIAGDIFAVSSAKDYRKQVFAGIEEDAFICGQVYSGGLTDLKGTVYGSVTTERFELRTNSAVYENHLLGAVIDKRKCSPGFVSPALVPGRKQIKAVAAWLK